MTYSPAQCRLGGSLWSALQSGIGDSDYIIFHGGEAPELVKWDGVYARWDAVMFGRERICFETCKVSVKKHRFGFQSHHLTNRWEHRRTGGVVVNGPPTVINRWRKRKINVNKHACSIHPDRRIKSQKGSIATHGQVSLPCSRHLGGNDPKPNQTVLCSRIPGRAGRLKAGRRRLQSTSVGLNRGWRFV